METITNIEPIVREEKKKELFRKQKQTLDLFLEKGAISQQQYNKPLGDLIMKMNIKPEKIGNTF